MKHDSTIRWGRFVWNAEKESGFSEPAPGAKRGSYMKRKYRRDPNRPIGKLTPVPDFLPPPHELLPPGSKMKITIELDEASVAFFKSKAQRYGNKYQRLMREVLRRYALHHSTKRAA